MFDIEYLVANDLKVEELDEEELELDPGEELEVELVLGLGTELRVFSNTIVWKLN